MATLRLVVAVDEFFSQSKSGTIWGRVYFETENGFFPDNGWTDMVVAFSSAWLETLIRIATRSTNKERTWFMDGPFAVDLSPSGSGIVEVNFIHKETVKQSANARVEDLLDNAVAVGRQLVDQCQQRAWSDSDTQAIVDVTSRGAVILASLRT